MTALRKCKNCGMQPDTDEFWYHRPTRIRCKKCEKSRTKKHSAKIDIEIKRAYARNSRKRIKAKRWTKALLNFAKYSRPKRGLEFDISEDYLSELHREQNGRCYYSNIEFTYTTDFRNPTFPSIDRIDSSKGYVRGNVVLCAYWINTAKGAQEAGSFVRLLGDVDTANAPFSKPRAT